MINPAPLPSGYYIIEGGSEIPSLAFRIQQEKDNNDVNIGVQLLTINSHLLVYNGGWQESDFSVDDAMEAIQDVISNLYNGYYQDRSIVLWVDTTTTMSVYVPPLEQFRGIINPDEQLTENYPVFANPAPVVCGYFTIESEDNPTLSGLCVELKAFKATSTDYVEVHASLLKSGNDYVAYRNGAFTTIANGTSGISDFVESVVGAYAQASFVGTNYYIGSFNIGTNVTFDNLPSAEFFTKIQAS